MKKNLWLLMALFSVTAQAATLTVADKVKLLAVDGKEVKGQGWSEVESVELTDGKHQIVVRFDGEVKRGSKTTIYTTRPYLFDIDLVDRNAEITLPRLTTESQAKAFFERGATWQLALENGVTKPLVGVELQGDGFAAYSDIEAVIAAYNRDNGIVIEQGNAVDLQQVSVNVDNETGKVEITGDALIQLKMWYTKASKEDKKAFKIWMAEKDFN
ncbi:DUF2057 domain-containing protein [Photobacterium sp. NCIMB 13483]|uniref:UPF0319 protein CZ809_01597 n=1 Tax=Photobacterium piscicola TaxID=1378299 RepID=A0A1T5HZ73_9GAMM|nr:MULTISPECIES: DUF2057 domain-containing protein [Photobacterium]PST94805.1 DUF2057 domain-containing protein [Photobacterium sp. NCIMB 13483]SKC32083.1 hypothetical protein CZ809_01597 [Photobacterium piscicola]